MIPSVARKYILAVTGLFLVSFLVTHLAGNLLLLKADNGIAFNAYAHFMGTNVVIRIAEIILLIGFLAHITFAGITTHKNRQARKMGYAKNQANSNSSFPSRYMHLTGALILVFIVIHLKSYFVPIRFEEISDVYNLVKLSFSDPLYTAFYLFSFLVLALHLSHGFQSAFQSLGLHHIKYTFAIKLLGYTVAVLIPTGFGLIPIYFYFSACCY